MKPLCRISSFAFLTTIVVVVVVICLIELQFLSQPEGVAASDVLTSGVSSPSNVELQYGIVIDCGSSGTRIFIYCWPPHNGDPKDLLDLSLAKDKNGKPAVKKIEPGVSSFVNNPSEVSDSMAPLLSYAAEVIPPRQHKSTPVYVMATAGMRSLRESEQKALLADLQVDLPLLTNFQFANVQVEVITGKQEGVYAWIAINYVMKKFDHTLGDDPLVVVQLPGADKQTHVRKQTIGVLDMGGGSLQIAFELPDAVKFSSQEESAKNLIAEFNLGCSDEDLEHTYRVYVTTFLGYGTNSVRQRYEEELVMSVIQQKTNDNSTANSVAGLTPSNPRDDPCLPVGMAEEVKLASGESCHVRGTGDFVQCKHILAAYLNQSVPCTKEPCSLGGVFQPEIDMRHSAFYGFSEFYYTMEDVLQMGGKYEYVSFYKAAQNYCATNWSTIVDWEAKNVYPRATRNRYRMQCFKSSWMATVLHDGLHLPTNYKQLTSVQHVGDSEVHWSLGALLYKTRYYPLREIEKTRTRPKSKSGPMPFSELGRIYYVAAIFALFIAACGCFGIKQCQRQRRTRKASRLYTSLDLDNNMDCVLNDLDPIRTIY